MRLRIHFERCEGINMKKKDAWIAVAFIVAFGAIVLSYIRINGLERRTASSDSKEDLSQTLVKPKEVLSANVAVFDLEGSNISVPQLFKGQKTLAIFFSTECPACLHNAHWWEELYESYGSKNINFLGLSVSPVNDPVATKRFVAYNQLKFRVLLIPVSEIHKWHNRFAVPQVAVFNGQGVVDTAWVGDLAVKNTLGMIDNYLRVQMQ